MSRTIETSFCAKGAHCLITAAVSRKFGTSRKLSGYPSCDRKSSNLSSGFAGMNKSNVKSPGWSPCPAPGVPLNCGCESYTRATRFGNHMCKGDSTGAIVYKQSALNIETVEQITDERIGIARRSGRPGRGTVRRGLIIAADRRGRVEKMVDRSKGGQVK